MKKLLVVDEAFVVGSASRGVLVMPKFVADDARRDKFAVKLVRPDGSEKEARASIDLPHVRGALAPFGMLRLWGVALDDVPAGTEIWADQNATRSGPET
ncbi:MAG TPA: hypothetical protein VIF62_35595 [Labilithrix sp.]